MADKVLVVEDGSPLKLKRKSISEVDGYAAPTDEQVDTAVSAWLNDHPEATTTVDFRVVNKVFSNISEAINDLSLETGDYVKTNGFHSEGDGGQAYYKILSTGTANGKDVFEIDTTPKKYAHLITTGNYYDPMQYGAYGDGDTDDSVFVQYALNKALETNGALLVTKSHKINNVAINKTTELRQPTYIIGKGGAFISDHDVMFKYEGSTGYTSDIYFINICFDGDSDSTAIDCTRIFRVYFENCEFNGFKRCLYTDGLMQSYIVDGCVFTNIAQSCVEYNTSYAVKILNCIAENTTDGRFIKASALSTNLTIRDCCIEGFRNIIPIYLSSCTAVAIQSNYFELNDLGDIEFNPSASDINAVTVSGNQNRGITDATIAMVKWAGLHVRNCQSFGNESAGAPINNMNDVPDHNYIASYNNRTGSSAGVDINAKYITNPFRDDAVRNPGKLSYERINNFHRRFAISAELFTQQTELFKVTSPYTGRGHWHAVLNISGVIGNIGSYSAQYILHQNGTITPISQSRDISSYLVLDYSTSANSVSTISIKTNASYQSSAFVDVELFGDIVSVIFDGVTFK